MPAYLSFTLKTCPCGHSTRIPIATALLAALRDHAPLRGVWRRRSGSAITEGASSPVFRSLRRPRRERSLMERASPGPYAVGRRNVARDWADEGLTGRPDAHLPASVARAVVLRIVCRCGRLRRHPTLGRCREKSYSRRAVGERAHRRSICNLAIPAHRCKKTRDQGDDPPALGRRFFRAGRGLWPSWASACWSF